MVVLCLVFSFQGFVFQVKVSQSDQERKLKKNRISNRRISNVEGRNAVVFIQMARATHCASACAARAIPSFEIQYSLFNILRFALEVSHERAPLAKKTASLINKETLTLNRCNESSIFRAISAR